jgi:hypothetical protein
MMRLFTAKILMIGLVLFGATSANAYILKFNNLTGTSPVMGVETANVGDIITIQLRIDTEGVTDTTSIFVSAFADPSILSFNPNPASSSPGLALFNGDSGEFLSRVSQPVLGFGDPPGLVRAGNFATTNAAGSGASNANQLLATLSFTAVGGGDLQIQSVYSGPGGDVITQLQVNTVQPVTTQSSVNIHINAIPEPGTALLMGLGLAGLGVAGRRKA